MRTSQRNSMRKFGGCLLMIAALALASETPALAAQPSDVAQIFSADEVASATSPDGSIRVAFRLNGEGRVGYTIQRAGKPIIDESHLGFLFTDAPQMLRNFALVSQKSHDEDGSWDTPWGEWRTIRNHYREIDATFEEKSALHRRMEVQFRIYDNGVGFRIVFPRQPNLTTANIAEELTQFAVHSDGTAWWDPAFESNREEYLFNRTPIREIGTAQTPMTMRLDDGTHLSFHEAALVDYSAMDIARVQGTQLKAVLTPSSQGAKVVRQTPFSTPWRTIAIASDAKSLYPAANQLILNLNEPNKLGDVSWVHPRKYVGIWWGMHLDDQTWSTGPKHGATTANTIALIDFAAKNKIPGVLVEGWNTGWDGEWFGNGWDFSFTKAAPDFDLPRIAAYARSKGVHLIGHHETAANIANYEPQMAAAFDQSHRFGIDAIKTGYVSDAGGVQARRPDGKIAFEWHEGQVMVNHDLQVVTEAAKRHITIDTHEPVKDTGLRRTYPNWVAREGQRGQEYNAWGVPKNPPEHEENLFFTRMTSGPFDFTPGVVSLKGRGNSDILSTVAKQLALYLVLYSPVQMAADLPANYEANPVAFRFIKMVPTDWDDTRVIGGEVGDYVIVARKERGRRDWYLGATTNAEARDITAPLGFLTPGRHYTAMIWRDGPIAHFGAAGKDMVYEERKVTSQDTLALHLAPGGGAAVRLKY
jgi:alpha-glucosidase